ncbi:MAG: polyketide synthase, partial [Moorea sp. SIO2I5]|nr:polyketide synthase [Moorena sp. SIO2I5]
MNIPVASSRNGLEVAIIGMAGRFPGAKSTEEFWQNLRDGIESVTTFSDEDLIASGVDSAVLQDPNYVKAGAFLEEAEFFDAFFFGFNPREAEVIDPQQRVFLECSWEALENAGYNSQTYEGLIGVYAGVGMNSYASNIWTNETLRNSIGSY